MDPVSQSPVQGPLSPPNNGAAVAITSGLSPGILPLPPVFARHQAPGERSPALALRKAKSSSAPPVEEPWLAQALRSRWETYRDRLDECREEPSVGSVHELRVAARRLIAQVIVLVSVFPGRKALRVRRMLKRQLESLSALRDLHVQRAFFERQGTKFPELWMLNRELKRRERELVKTACRQIKGFKTRKLDKCVCGLIAGLTQDLSVPTRQGGLTALALSRAAEAFAETVGRWRSIEFSDLSTIHRTRVAFKTFRYIVESLPPQATGWTKRHLRSLASYQRRMGNIQDLEVIQACTAAFIQSHAGIEALFLPFAAYLRARRARALRSFRRSADKLLQFWPPPGLPGTVRSCQKRAA